MWYDVVERLDPARFTSHLLDFRGTGLSDRPATGHDVEGYASDLRAAIANIDAPLTIVAHSMGGKIAQYVALEAPPHLERMILVAPGRAQAVPVQARHRALAEAAFGSRDRIEQFQRAAMSRTVSFAAMERIVEDALLAPREAWFGWYDYGRLTDFSDRLGSIAIPTYVIAGEKDPLAPPDRVKRDVAGLIPKALFFSYKNAGHNLPIEAPDEIAAFIERVESRWDKSGG